MKEPPHNQPNDPRLVDDGRARPAVQRGQGVTDSERYLGKLADRSFLDLWSYPNVFIDKKSRGKGHGKELCDLLVVCGDLVLIFSDKAVAWPGGDDVILAWSRWYRRAIEKSVDQIRGAQRWIRDHRDRIFIDPACTQKLPLILPPPDRMKMHGIIVANGAAPACREHYKGGIGSLVIAPDIKGAAHYQGDYIQPFTVGDVDPDGPFVHVLDEATLDIVMGELDTVHDFTSYLTKRETLIRSGGLLGATGEEELVAQYMIRMNAAGEHDFTKSEGTPWAANERVTYAAGTYAELRANPQYRAKKRADRISYVWDQLITKFTAHMIAGTSLVPPEQSAELSEQEIPVRHMALLPRFVRRIFGQSFIEALEEGRRAYRFGRTIMPGPNYPEPHLAYFFVTLKVPREPLPRGYQQYRETRVALLRASGLNLLRQNPTLKAVVGIACEPARSLGDVGGSSADVCYIEQPIWNDQLLKDLDAAVAMFELGKNSIQRPISESEYPEIEDIEWSPEGDRSMTRRERRARFAEERRRRKRRREV